MQVTIGIKHSGRELSLETSASQDEVLEVLAGASTKDVTLADVHGGPENVRESYVQLLALDTEHSPSQR